VVLGVHESQRIDMGIFEYHNMRCLYICFWSGNSWNVKLIDVKSLCLKYKHMKIFAMILI
jgi:hypothetical protein